MSGSASDGAAGGGSDRGGGAGGGPVPGGAERAAGGGGDPAPALPPDLRELVGDRLRAAPVPDHPALAGVEAWLLDTAGAEAEALAAARLLPAIERPDDPPVGAGARARDRRIARALGRATLRGLLAGRGVPSDVPHEVGRYGRPTAPGGPAFGLSYAGPVVGIVLGPSTGGGGAVAIDVEPLGRSPRDGAGLGRSSGWSEAECALVVADPDAFLRLWTLKEAVAKAAGTGIGSKAWAVPVADRAAPQEVAGPTGRWIVGSGKDDGHLVAIAVGSATDG